MKIIQGNLFHTEIKIIGHQVNCLGIMGGGVAKTVKEVYPKAFREYKSFLRKNHKPLGEVNIVSILGGKFYIGNIFGQDSIGWEKKQTDEEMLLKGVKTLMEFAMEIGETQIALPYKIGCFRGGGDWEVVYNGLKELESDIQEVEIVLYKL